MVIFGASGDLAKRKLLPALYNLAAMGQLPEKFSVVGYARSEMNDEDFRQRIPASVAEFVPGGISDKSLRENFAQRMAYVRGGYEDSDGYRRLKEMLAKIDAAGGSRMNRIFYLATPPDLNYENAFGTAPPEAYETLLIDCMRGDSTLFTRHDWVELAWSLITPILQGWESTPPANFPNYQAGTWGPKEADTFLQNDGRFWRRP